MADYSFGSSVGNVEDRKRTGVQVAHRSIEVTTAMIDNADDNIFVDLKLKSSDILLGLDIYSDDLDSNGTPALAYNIGLAYGRNQIGKAEDTIIDADCIGTAVTVGQAANTTGGQLQYEANDIANIGKQLWEIAGLSSDPKCSLKLVLDVTTAAATPVAGTIAFRVLLG